MEEIVDRLHHLVYTDESGKYFDILTGDEVKEIPEEKVPLWGYFMDKDGVERHIAELFYGATPDLKQTLLVKEYFIGGLNRDAPWSVLLEVKRHIFYKVVVDIEISDEGAVCSQLIGSLSSGEVQGDIYANTFHVCGNMPSQKLSFNTGLFQVSNDMSVRLLLEYSSPVIASIPIYGRAKLLSFSY